MIQYIVPDYDAERLVPDFENDDLLSVCYEVFRAISSFGPIFMISGSMESS